ncbi:MAG TPA: cation-translocating P-type ATPase [Gemmatimonadaceae bacterium]|nr:cation-translocating P-type ATPase [Gemmatimonadaceae bacterium]
MTLNAITDATRFELPDVTKQVEPPADRHDVERESIVSRTDGIRVAVVALTAGLVWFRVWEPFPRVSLLGLAGTVAGGWPIFHEAWTNLLDRRMTMELSMTIALVAALLVGEFFTALVITIFVLGAEILEGLTVGQGRRAIRDLLDLLPRTATVRRGSGSVRIALAIVKVGDAVLVSPGERIPVDGIVRGGESYVDQSAITGESVPVAKRTGSPVFAGTINQSGALEVVVDRVGRETSFGKIIEAVERAERSQAPVQKVADRYAGYLVVFALACAAVTLAVTRDARSTISVIIVAGACGIAAGTPLAILCAIGRAARAGAIIKGGRHLEALWDVEVVALDKTGTVTIGAPTVASLHPAEGISSRVLLETAAIAERRSEHPLARAIIAAADGMGVPPVEPTSLTYSPGRGIVARSGLDDILVGSWAFAQQQGVTASVRAKPPRATTEVVVVRDGLFLGTIWIADTVRPEARQAIRRLREAGLRTVLLTGDARSVADAVGNELQVDDVQAELLPDQKTALVRELTTRGRRVAMVGDGINDAPALVEATVGLAMGSGTDVARESADIVLLGNDLSTFADVVQLARRTRNIIRFNFAGTIAVDAVGVALAAAGLLNPLLAAFIHVASELAFILNSARLLPPAQAH